MTEKLLLIAAASLLLTSTAMAGDYDWSGAYAGGSVGVVQSNTNANVDYGYADGYTPTATPGDLTTANDDPTAPGGHWSNGMYYSDYAVYNYLNLFRTSNNYGGNETSGVIDENAGSTWLDTANPDEGSIRGTALSNDADIGNSDLANLSFNPATPWPNSFDQFVRGAYGAVQAGVNYQNGALVIGGEADAAVMNQTTTYGQSFAEAAQATSDDRVYPILYDTDFWSSYDQHGNFNYTGTVSDLFTARAKIGVAVEDNLFFLTGGVAAGQVSMSTHAETTETSDASWEGDFEGDYGNDHRTNKTTWDASKKELDVGYAVGAGMSHALTQNVVWTVEGMYYDLGEHSLTATDNHGETSYTVSQRFNGFVGRTGLDFRF